MLKKFLRMCIFVTRRWLFLWIGRFWCCCCFYCYFICCWCCYLYVIDRHIARTCAWTCKRTSVTLCYSPSPLIHSPHHHHHNFIPQSTSPTLFYSNTLPTWSRTLMWCRRMSSFVRLNHYFDHCYCYHS